MNSDIDTQAWLSIAASIEPEFLALSRMKRTAFLEMQSSMLALNPQTVRRMIKAFQYVSAHAKSVGLSNAEVNAPVSSVEALIRLEGHAPAKAAEIRRKVLLGRITYRKILAIEKENRKVRSIKSFKEVDWDAFAIELQYDLFKSIKSWTFHNKKSNYSKVGKLINVDLEFSVDNENDTAVFLSPSIIFSLFKNKPIEQQIPWLFMATFYYENVIYLLWDSTELDLFRKIIGMSSYCKEPRISSRAFLDLPSGINWEAYRS